LARGNPKWTKDNPPPTAWTKETRPTPGKRGPSKPVAKAREAIAKFVDGNSGRLQEGLDEVAFRDGPKAALKAFSDYVEYHVPRLARTEVTGEDSGPIKITVQWQEPEKKK